MDLLKITYLHERDGECIRYCANIASLGLSGAVDHFFYQQSGWKWMGGKTLFLLETLEQALYCPQSKIMMRIDD